MPQCRQHIESINEGDVGNNVAGGALTDDVALYDSSEMAPVVYSCTMSSAGNISLCGDHNIPVCTC